MNYDNYDILVDGMNIAYRSSFIFDKKQRLATAQGVPTGTVYGVLKHMLKLRNRFPGANFYVVWEGKGSLKARQAVCPDYKANRGTKLEPCETCAGFGVALGTDETCPKCAGEGSLPPAIFLQLTMLRDALEAIGVHQLSAAGYEADDVIGAFARASERQVVIVSSDKDLLQLVTDTVVVMTPKEEFFDTSKVLEKYGVSPEDLLTYKSLDGDKSDNLPGLFRFPRKKIAALVNENHDLESIYTEHGMELTEFQSKTLDEFQDQAFKNRQVMSLHDVKNYDVRQGEHNVQTIAEICDQLEFESLQQDLVSFPVLTGFVRTGQGYVGLLHPTTGSSGVGKSVLD